MNRLLSNIRWLVFLLLCLLNAGCGNSSDYVVTGQNGGGAVAQTGTLRIESVLAKAVPSQVDQLRITGFNTTGAVIFGPRTEPKAAVIVVENVPVAVVRVQIEYLANGRIRGVGSSPVAITAGQETRLRDPNFQDIEAELQSLIVTPASASIPNGTSQQFAAVGVFDDGTQLDLSTVVAWSSSAQNVATVYETGQARGISTGTTTISAELSGVAGASTLGVTNATLISLEIEPGTASIADGTTQAFTVTGRFSDGTTLSLTGQAALTSANPNVATIDSFTGLATAVDPGQTTITASFQGVTAISTLTVTNATLTSIEVTPAGANLPSGVALQYTATGTFSDGSRQDLTSSVVWTSTSASTATADSSGLVRAGTPGTTDIVATLRSVTGRTALTVSAATLTSLAITPTSTSIPQGATEPLTVTGSFTDGTTRSVVGQATVTSSNTTAVTVLSSTAVATGVNLGSSTINASLGGLTASANVTVTASIVSITIEPPIALSAPGATRQYRAVATLSDGSTADVTEEATWGTNAADVAISNSSQGTDRKGKATLAPNAAYGQNVTVTATVGSVTATPSNLTVNLFVYVANRSAFNISLYSVTDRSTGALTAQTTTAANSYPPNSIAIHPSGRYAYTGSQQSYVYSYLVNPNTGALTLQGPGLLGGVGGRRLGIFMHPSGRFVYVANFDSNSVTMFDVRPEDGVLTGGKSLGTANLPERITSDPAGRFLYVACPSGGAISQYRIDQQTGELTALATRDLVASDRVLSLKTDPTGRFAYAGTLVNSVGLYTLGVDATSGALSLTEALVTGTQTFDIVMDPGGTIFYGMGGGASSVTPFRYDSATGSVTRLAAVSTPGDGSFQGSLDPSGRYLYVINNNNNTVTALRADAAAGTLTIANTVGTNTVPVWVTTTP